MSDLPRIGNWMQTFSGHAYWPLDPRPEEVNIVDIAHSLAMQCRYAGHVDRFYSVAEHSVHVSRVVPFKHALVGLLHDAPEAYLVDVPRPVKRHLTNYKNIEELNWKCIVACFGLDPVMPACVHEADAALLFAEKAALMKPSPLPGWGMGDDAEPAQVAIEGWLPARGKKEFLQRFWELMEEQT